ncbi:MAG: hypothetical protein QOF36_2594 [Microbacteriaceae bacterium]|jgi:hypothetical protein|nr:hypothetical protein [Microbacteriaceae bacterium]
MADTSTTAVKGATYLPKAVPIGQDALTVLEVNETTVWVVRHHAVTGVERWPTPLNRQHFEALHVECDHYSAWRARMPDQK